MKTDDLRELAKGEFRFAYRRKGSGPPLLLFHGGEGDHQIYDRLQDELAAAFDVISFDQRDCGATAWSAPCAYTLADIAGDGVALLDGLGIGKAHVLGNSIGGVLAQIMAARWATRVDRLVLGLTWPADQRLHELNPEGIRRRMEYAARGEAGERSMAELMAGPAYVSAHPEILDELRALRTEVAPEARARRTAAFAGAVAVDPAMLTPTTLVIAGAEDRMVPPDIARGLAERIPGARFVLLDGAGHLAARQHPAALADLVSAFLQYDTP